MNYILSFGLARTQTHESFPQMDPLGLALPKVFFSRTRSLKLSKTTLLIRTDSDSDPKLDQSLSECK